MYGIADLYKGHGNNVEGSSYAGESGDVERGKGKHIVEAWMTAHIRLMIRRALQKHPRNDTIKIGEPEIPLQKRVVVVRNRACYNI